MKLSPTTVHFLETNRAVCLAGAGALVAFILLAVLFALREDGLRSAADSAALGRVQLVSLPDVRRSGQVPPHFVRRIDTNLSVLPAAERKRAFIRMLLPLIARENDRIRADRQKLRQGNPPGALFDEYGVPPGDIVALRRRLDILPAALVLAQAALESGWGTSRFALEGNNLFGMRTYDKDADGIAPAGATGFKVMRFRSLGAGVAAYMRNLNTHTAYRDLRTARAALHRDGKPVSGAALTHYLSRYSEIPETYGQKLRGIIARERLSPFDAVSIGAEE